jgi:transcriptional regulator with XRE-family HTH domain
MPAQKNARNKNKPKRPRPSRGVTQFPGSSTFAKEADLTPSHVWRVLSGERQSAKTLNGYLAWLRANQMSIPRTLMIRAA